MNIITDFPTIEFPKALAPPDSAILDELAEQITGPVLETLENSDDGRAAAILTTYLVQDYCECLVEDGISADEVETATHELKRRLEKRLSAALGVSFH